MPRQVDRYVAENRQRIRGVDRRFIEVDSNQNRDFSFGPSTVEAVVSIELYKRTTGGQIIPGHSEDAHGFGRGTFGDDRGAWSSVTTTEASVEFTKKGREAVAEALNGEAGAVEEGVAGVDGTTASTGDTALGDERERVGVFATKDDFRTVRTYATYGASTPTGVVEFGLVDGDGRLLCRVTIASQSIATDDELKANILVEFVGDGIGNSVVTNDGEEAVADAFKDPKSNVGPTEFGFGSGSTTFSKSDSALTTEEFRKACARELGRDFVIAKTHVYEDESGVTEPVDISEMAVFDNSGRMVWATTMRQFTNTDSIGFNAESLIQVV